MDFHFHKPSGFLSHFVESIVFFEHYDGDYKAEKMLPDGYHDLVIDLTETPKHIFDNETLQVTQTCTNSWLSGARQKLLTRDAGGNDSSMMVIRFHYGSAFHFARMPACELTDSVVDTDLLFGNKVNELREKVIECGDPDLKFSIVEKFLTNHLLRLEIPDIITHSVHLIKENPSTHTIKQITEKMGYSQKHFIHLFKKHVGLTPKAFQRIQRFQKIIYELESDQMINWTSLSLDCGYFDQAHFINDFRAFSGMNPKQYLLEKGPLMNYISVK
ncbi:MAG: AraC family transcriptional regulator [Cyclobacteriaceae bacterium]